MYAVKNGPQMILGLNRSSNNNLNPYFCFFVSFNNLLCVKITRGDSVRLTGEFEKQVKKLNLDPKFEKVLIDMFNKASSEDPCVSCESKGDCENFKWHKKWLNTDSCNCCP